MLKVLFLCTENACRSQMAEGLVNHDLAGQVQAFSAGVRPSRVNPRAIQVMAELGIDISRQRSKSVSELAGEPGYWGGFCAVLWTYGRAGLDRLKALIGRVDRFKRGRHVAGPD